jgi:fucose permease
MGIWVLNSPLQQYLFNNLKGSENLMKQNKSIYLIPVMLSFFCMGFVDLVGIASNYVKEDLGLNDATANIFPSLVFFWFLIFSVPTGMLMNKIGRKKTVLLSLIITVVSLFIPLLGNSFVVMLVAFSLLGIGNALMQTSINPLAMLIIGDKNLASTLTFGQFVKAIASFLAPYLAMWGATKVIPSFGYDWRVLFIVYLVVGIISSLLLWVTPIKEEVRVEKEDAREGLVAEYVGCLRLLGKPVVLLSFFAIMCHVGIDVGTNTTAPKLLIERVGMSLNEAAFATSLYFIFRTIGSLTGSFFLRVMKTRWFFIFSVVIMAASMVLMFVGESKAMLYTAIALVGYGNSNIFSMAFSEALLSVPDKQNEVSGLMIMGLFGGTIFPLIMGFCSDAVGQAGAVAIMAIGVIYLFTFIPRVKH